MERMQDAEDIAGTEKHLFVEGKRQLEHFIDNDAGRQENHQRRSFVVCCPEFLSRWSLADA